MFFYYRRRRARVCEVYRGCSAINIYICIWHGSLFFFLYIFFSSPTPANATWPGMKRVSCFLRKRTSPSHTIFPAADAFLRGVRATVRPWTTRRHCFKIPSARTVCYFAHAAAPLACNLILLLHSCTTCAIIPYR